MTATQTRWLVTALDEGRKVEARRDRAELAAERRFMAERRREAHGAGRAISAVLALGLITAGLGLAAATPVVNGTTLIAAPLLVTAGGWVIGRLWGAW